MQGERAQAHQLSGLSGTRQSATTEANKTRTCFARPPSHTWDRITYLLRQKHRIGWPEIRRKFCLPGTRRLAHDGERFCGATTATVTRYRYLLTVLRGDNDQSSSGQPGA